MVLIASGHNASMNLSYQIGCDRPVYGKLPNPAVGPHCGVRLTLRPRAQLLGRNIGPDCLIQFSLGELRALDPAGSSDLAFELQLLESLDPALLIGEGRERPHGRFGFNKGGHDGACVIENPAFWQLIANHEFSWFISCFIFNSFSSHILPSLMYSVNYKIVKVIHIQFISKFISMSFPEFFPHIQPFLALGRLNKAPSL